MGRALTRTECHIRSNKDNTVVTRPCQRFRVPRIIAMASIVAVVLPAFAAGQTPPTSAPATDERVPVAVFNDAAVIPRKMAPSVPDGEDTGGREGRVRLAFMVDPRGKPFEVTVMRSTGDKVLEQMAIRCIEHSTFEPASVNGKPIEGDLELNIKYNNPQPKRTSNEFIAAYASLMQAIAASDRAAADEAMGRLKVGSLYEDALMGMAHYNYALKWGNDEQQLTGLERTLDGSDLLHADLYRSALVAALRLEVKTFRYGEAMSTWQRIQKAGVAPDIVANLKSIIEQLEKSRIDDTSYEVQGALTEGRWYMHLFKTHFRAVISKGSISQVKLRCKRRFLSFNFDPGLQYEVRAKDGDCVLQFEGEPGTEFRLVQF
jgi:TonB family protein